MAEFEINGHIYKNTKFPLMDALNWLIEIGPLFVTNETEGPAGVLVALREVPRERIHMIISSCLASCERKMPSGKGWTKIWNIEAQRAMFDELNDIGLASKIIWAVMKDNYASFLQGKG